MSNNDSQQSETTTKKGAKATHGKQGDKQSGRNTKSSKVPTRKSPRKKGGILNIAVEKIIEIPSEKDNMQVDETQLKKTDSFMDTESDYNMQNEEIYSNI